MISSSNLTSSDGDETKNKAVKRSSGKSERPIFSLESVAGKTKKSPTSPQNRPGRSASHAITPKPSILTNDLFKHPDDEKGRLDDEKSVPSEFQTKIISTKSSTELIAEIEKILTKNNVQFTTKGFVFKCKSNDGVSEVQFTIEIVKKTENDRGIKIKRIGGSGFAYQIIYQSIVKDLEVIL